MARRGEVVRVRERPGWARLPQRAAARGDCRAVERGRPVARTRGPGGAAFTPWQPRSRGAFHFGFRISDLRGRPCTLCVKAQAGVSRYGLALGCRRSFPEVCAARSLEPVLHLELRNPVEISPVASLQVFGGRSSCLSRWTETLAIWGSRWTRMASWTLAQASIRASIAGRRSRPKTSVFRSASAPPRVILENVSRDSYRLWCDRAKVSCLHAAIAQFCWCFPV